MDKKMVYLLEDDPDISELIAYILEEDYTVIQCGTVREFNGALTNSLPDIFIIDIQLPDGNGLDICRLLKAEQHTSGIPVLMMSANKTTRDIKEAGCDADFIAKPFNIDHFRERIDQFV